MDGSDPTVLLYFWIPNRPSCQNNLQLTLCQTGFKSRYGSQSRSQVTQTFWTYSHKHTTVYLGHSFRCIYFYIPNALLSFPQGYAEQGLYSEQEGIASAPMYGSGIVGKV